MTVQMLTCTQVSINFNNKTVLANVNLCVNQGDCLVITGKSGAGKTVLLKALAGNLAINKGTIVYSFNTGQSSPQSHISFAGVKHHFKNLTNTSNLYYQQRYNSTDSEDSLKVKEYLLDIKSNKDLPVYWTFNKAITALSLVHLLDKQVIKLSNGETKRLILAAALLKNPALLLLDNPLTGLDVKTRGQFDVLLTEIITSGITVILAASAAHIPSCATQVAVLNEGMLTINTPNDFQQNEARKSETFAVDTAAIKDLLAEGKQHRYHRIVEMQNVIVRYGDKLILNKINWIVKSGERWALLGHNGAGKSTLLSLINGDNPQAYANHIILFDKKRGTGESIWDIKSKTGFVSPELYQYFPNDNSCLQVVESGFYDTLGLFRPSNATRAELALRWMKALEINQYAHTLLKNIPAAAQRLCLLARALVKNPPLLIFDEPCQGLDEQQLQRFKIIIDTICSMSTVTLIYVTHYQNEIPDSVDNVLRLDNGEMVIK